MHLLDMPALTEDESEGNFSATYHFHASQYGVLDGSAKGLVKVYGDQEWVKSGAPAAEADSFTMVREIWITYGPWQRAD